MQDKQKKNASSKKAESAIEKRDKVKSDLKRYRQQFEKNWQNEENAYYGDIWKNNNTDKPVENHIFKTVEIQVPIISDSMPAPTVTVDDPAYIEQAKNLGKAIEWVNKKQNFALTYPILVRKQLLTGTSYLHTYYDANANNGDGQIVDEVLGWKQVYLSGRGPFIENCDKARIELYRTVDWLCLNYPRQKDKIKGTKADSKMDIDLNEGREDFDIGARGENKQAPKQYTDEDTRTLVKTYVKDYSLVKIPTNRTVEELEQEAAALEEGSSPDVTKWQDHKAHMETHDAKLAELYAQLELTPDVGIEGAAEVVEMMAEQNPEADFSALLSQISILEAHREEHRILDEENPNGEMPKYKNYMRVIETVGSVVLYDGEILDEHGQIPVIPFYAVKSDCIYGTGTVRAILDSQRMHSVMQFKEYKGLQRVANPAVLVDQETGLTEEDLSNEDGAVYVLPSGSTIRHLDPGSVSTQVGQFQGDRVAAIQDISGVNEVTEGKMPSPNASGVTVEKIEQQAVGRIRLIDRQNQYYSIKRLAMLRASMILQYWTGEKVLKLENEGGDYSQLIFNPMDYQDINWEIEISSGSMAGVDKDSFNGMVASFLNAGHLTFDEFLQVAELPRKEKMRELVGQRSEQEAQMQELATQNEQLMQQLIGLKSKVEQLAQIPLLSPEERRVSEQQERDENLAEIQGVNDDQPFLGEQ